MSRLSLPEFPWDRVIPFRERACGVSGGMCDLSIGTPVDPVPQLIQDALAAGANSPGYPTTIGTEPLRQSMVDWMSRRLGVESLGVESLLPSIGSKELIAWLPTLLGLGPGDIVIIPETAYPTYEVGAMLAGCQIARADSLTAIGPARPALLWLNSPSNPTGKVLPVEHLRKVVEWARERDVIVASDECYIELPWEAEPVSILHPSVCGDIHDNVLAVHSLSKRSNLAGYRCGLVAGDPRILRDILEVRKHAGLMVPAPIQHAAAVAFDDDEHVSVQREIYGRRRATLRAALIAAGFRIDDSEAGLYLWATRGEDCWQTMSAMADLGIVVAPGEFYGPAGRRNVRVAITASDERIELAAQRLVDLPLSLRLRHD